MVPKVGSGAGQSSAWVKALTNDVMVLTSTWSAMSCTRDKYLQQCPEKKEPQKRVIECQDLSGEAN